MAMIINVAMINTVAVEILAKPSHKSIPRHRASRRIMIGCRTKYCPEALGGLFTDGTAGVITNGHDFDLCEGILCRYQSGNGREIV